MAMRAERSPWVSAASRASRSTASYLLDHQLYLLLVECTLHRTRASVGAHAPSGSGNPAAGRGSGNRRGRERAGAYIALAELVHPGAPPSNFCHQPLKLPPSKLMMDRIIARRVINRTGPAA